MVRAISKEQFIASAPQILTEIGEDLLVIQQDQRFVAALVGQREYEELQKKRGQRAIAAMNRISDAIEASGANEQELKELQAALDRKA